MRDLESARSSVIYSPSSTPILRKIFNLSTYSRSPFAEGSEGTFKSIPISRLPS